MGLEFNVFLDRRIKKSELGLTSIEELRGVAIYKKGSNAVADSLEALHGYNLIPCPTYLLVNGRSYSSLEDPGWKYAYDTLGERLTLKLERSYDGIRTGNYVVDIQNGGFFIPFPHFIRKAVNGHELSFGAFPISRAQKDSLLGDKKVYRWNGNKVEEKKVTLYSYEEFLEASSDPNFLKDMPVYAVLRTAEQASKTPLGYRLVGEQLNNPDVIIPCGGKKTLQRMLFNEKVKLHLRNLHVFASFHDRYKNTDSGRIIILHYGMAGIGCSSDLSSRNSRFVGIVPQSLELLLNEKHAVV